MQSNEASDVLEFMIRSTQLKNPISKPRLPKLDKRVQRNVMLQEEIKEYLAAEEAHDLPAIADALIDIVYIAIGTCHQYGIPFEAVWDIVHSSNMAKLTPAPVLSGMGKVMKPTGWVAPNIEKLLCNFGYDPTRTIEE